MVMKSPRTLTDPNLVLSSSQSIDPSSYLQTVLSVVNMRRLEDNILFLKISMMIKSFGTNIGANLQDLSKGINQILQFCLVESNKWLKYFSFSAMCSPLHWVIPNVRSGSVVIVKNYSHLGKPSFMFVFFLQ